MKERPILFNGPMVRAILEGRKTQTRRVVKVQPPSDDYKFSTLMSTTGPKKEIGKHRWVKEEGLLIRDHSECFTNPYGKPGDRLWVRETWIEGYYHNPDADDGPVVEVVYRADNESKMCAAPSYEFADDWMRQFSEDGPYDPQYHPSIFMPRWASRITLEVTGVRVERVQNISEDDAIAEGIDTESEEYNIAQNILDNIGGFPGASHDIERCSPEINEFKNLWDSINEKRGYGWDKNPWVWVVEFRRIKP